MVEEGIVEAERGTVGLEEVTVQVMKEVLEVEDKIRGQGRGCIGRGGESGDG